MLKYLQMNTVLWFLFGATLACVYGFNLWGPSAGGVLLDTLATEVDVQAQLDVMSLEEKNSHFWMTLILDMIFPIVYGGFFAGVALRFFEGKAKWLAVPAFTVALIDVAENTVQLFLLNDVGGLIALKPILTPAKFTLFNVAALIAVVALVFGLYRRFRPKSETTAM